MNMPISTNTASTGPIERTEDVDKAEDKALAYIKRIMIRIHTIENIYTKENTREAKKIKDSDKKSAMFVTNQATS
jgi:hypothetical protein